jgi:hypothetical protein
MKKAAVILAVILIALAAAVVFHIFEHETVTAGKYTVVYYKNMCDNMPPAFPQDLESLKSLPCLIRVTWQEQIASDMFQEYCYLPDKGVEKSRLVHKTR